VHDLPEGVFRLLLRGVPAPRSAPGVAGRWQFRQHPTNQPTNQEVLAKGQGLFWRKVEPPSGAARPADEAGRLVP
jgi:hypothetical protein